jgi:hypothetical protein
MGNNQRVPGDARKRHACADKKTLIPEFKRLHLRDFGQVNNGVDRGMPTLLQVKQNVRPTGKWKRRAGSGRKGSNSLCNGSWTDVLLPKVHRWNDLLRKDGGTFRGFLSHAAEGFCPATTEPMVFVL